MKRQDRWQLAPNLMFNFATHSVDYAACVFSLMTDLMENSRADRAGKLCYLYLLLIPLFPTYASAVEKLVSTATVANIASCPLCPPCRKVFASNETFSEPYQSSECKKDCELPGISPIAHRPSPVGPK